MAVVLKIAFDGQTIRIPFDSMPDYAAVDAAVKHALPNGCMYSAKYKDDEDDFCTLVESTFADFLMMATDSASHMLLRITVIPQPRACTKPPSHTVLQSRRARVCRQPAPRPVWVDDCRDLEELLREVEGEPVKKHSKKAKRKVCAPPNCHEQDCAVMPDVAEALAAMGDVEMQAQDQETVRLSSEHKDEATSHNEAPHGEEMPWSCTVPSEVEGQLQSKLAQKSIETALENVNQSAVNERVDCDVIVPGLYGDFKVVRNMSAEAREWEECQTEVGELETDDEPSWDFQTEGMLDAEKGELESGLSWPTLKKSSSCPCLSTWNAQGEDGGSLVAQAWPFVDADKILVNFTAPFPSNGPIKQPSKWSVQEMLPSPPAQEVFPSAHLPEYGYQQVVWMPVFVSCSGLGMPPGSVERLEVPMAC